MIPQLAAGAALLATLAFPAPSMAAEDLSRSKGFAEIAGCISGADNLLVAIVVDESASLRSTDPGALRVQGIVSAIDSLEQLGESAGRDLNIETTLATFARGYETLVGWGRLTPNNAAELRAVAVDELPGRDAGNATDYRQALKGAQSQLTARSARLNDRDACKVILWFTDGALDVDEATSTAAQELCQVGGIADGVRHAGINIVALALFTPGADVTPAQRDQLRAVAEGTGNQARCGTVPISADDAMGVYLPADDPAALGLLFAGAGALVAGGTPGVALSCPGPRCQNGRFEFQVDAGVAGARVVIQGGGSASLATPSGPELQLDDGLAQSIGDAAVTVLKRDTLTTLNLAFSPYAQAPSRWTLRLPDPARVETYWFWGAELKSLSTGVTAGGSNELRFQLVDATGAPFPVNTYRRLSSTVSVDGVDLQTTSRRDGTINAVYDLGTEEVPASVAIKVTATAVTKPSGIRLGPLVSTTRLKTELPPAFPAFAEESIDFGDVEGLDVTTTTIKITGSALGDTKACLARASYIVPGNEADPDAVAAQPDCVHVPQNGSAEIDVTLTPGQTADGLGTGELTFDLESAEGEHLEVSLPVEAQMHRKVDEAKRWELVIALTLLALLIPLLLLVASNYFILGRFTMTSNTRFARVPIRVTNEGISRPGHAELLQAEDLKNLPISGTERSSKLSIDGTGVTLEATRILSLRAPKGRATSSGALKLVSTTDHQHFEAQPSAAPVTLGQVDLALVALESREGEAAYSGTLLVVIPPEVDLAAARERARKLSTSELWPHLLATLVPAGPSVPAAAPSASGQLAAPTWLSDGPPTSGGTPSPAPGPDSTPPSSDDLPALPDFLRDKD